MYWVSFSTKTQEHILFINFSFSNIFGYKNDCPISEKIGYNIINIPLDISQNQLKTLIENILIKSNFK